MLIYTRTKPVDSIVSVRVTGSDCVEVAAAALKAGVVVRISPRGQHWFVCSPQQLATIRETHVTTTANLRTWFKLFRKKFDADPADKHTSGTAIEGEDSVSGNG